MNILYISHLSGSLFGGPNYSVPAQVVAQSKIDNVFWWNLNENTRDEWIKTGVFHNTLDVAKTRISQLVEPFNCPDLVVFEDFYYFDDYILAKECWKSSIPYVIVPRGALTKKAQQTKKIKKIVANWLFFRRYVKKSLFIHYLSDNERITSSGKWTDKCIVVPNGTKKRDFIPCKGEHIDVVGTYIGRLMPQKGIDLLIKAIINMSEELRKNRIKINIYGPKSYDLWEKYNNEILREGINDIVSMYDGVTGCEKEEVLSQSDFFIMTSRFEGMPMGLIEALSFSLPCLVTDGTNMAAEIDCHKAGWTSETSVEGISLALLELCNNKEKLADLRANAYELSLNYDWDIIANELHNQYTKWLRNRNN